MTNNHLKTEKSLGVMAIATFLVTCSITVGTLLAFHRNQSVIVTQDLPVPRNQVESPVKPQSPPPPKLDKLTFTVPIQYQGKTVYKVQTNSNEKVIALTFDDGPWQKTTPEILEILKQNQIKATFFWVGQAIQANPDIAKRVVAEGHAIGNHTWHHWYRRMNEATAKSEIERTSDLIYKTTGVKTHLFRPPGGVLNNGLVAYAKSQKNAVVMWSLTSADTDPRAKPEVFVKNVVKGAKPGYIVLMHDGGGDRQRTVKALPQIISGLKQQGYKFVTVPELLEMKP
ncbi:polysaccharide deacetylase family protein [Anabaena sp. FACHB-709]|uniref:Polysaccharide deacetylase family protein n=2 Tax=Nostocaceae TaxID=1162 RepID=A0ABR7ZKY3_ANACY|nr:MULTISPECIES: polysaccharide deacetylase family protein [Nostocaceae]BAY67410.1 putative oligosaccharide deacetylase [Trichormus variabilis NIES-23]HBW30894.1 polysaccharide deacetylase family protein [Nostoc sp. UBA8866]MBD2173351.1 polysaccharide deacetylase family protein [Anabaena cylindrica FACHB-318]MBD2265101.1 polysaccharide deacetylase family protein [Anabaena sp. FACHB-709]MBD2274412.1 polysaccharide deacetylase family protein [Nostoc sp. PCC 7120 = FACHB-418]